jgi:hypothetical protein
MRANFAGNIQREFHLIKRVLQVSSADSANDGTAFVANNVGSISMDDAIQTTAAIRIAEF